MRYLSVCSGIEAATVAWSALGWKAAAFAEVEAFPSAVLAHRYPGVPNVGDMTKINGADYRGLVNVLVGGTPCQSFSVAGLRRGLEDERGNLALEFVRIADESDPAFVVWENVPGVFSDRGNAFGCFLAALAGEDAPLLPPGGRWTNAGYVLGPRRAIAWRVLDAQYFGLPQRRKRVFLVACPRNGADPRKILFEFDGLRRDFAPRGKAGEHVAGTLDASFGRSRGAGQNPSGITRALTGRLGGGGPDDNKAQGGFYVPEIVCQPISCKWSKGTGGPAGDEHYNLVANTLRAEGFDASEDGTGRQNLVVAPPLTGNQYGDHESREALLVPMPSLGSVLAFDTTQIASPHNHSNPRPGDPCHSFSARAHPPAVAFHGSQDPDVSGDITHPLGTNQGQETCVMTFLAGQGAKAGSVAASKTLAPTLRSNGGGMNTVPSLMQKGAVRRLTPKECERLQGFPDGYTAVPWRGRPAGECPDGPRYRALGNSMAVPVMRWIGERIQKAGGA